MLERRGGREAEQGAWPERRLRLVSPGDMVEVRRLKSGNAAFHARPIGTDIGEVRLFGLHGGTDLDGSGLASVTVRKGKLIEDSGENLDSNQGLFYVGVEVLKGNPFWPNQALFCRLDIDSIDKSFEAELHLSGDDSQVGHDGYTAVPAWECFWRSTDPNDTKEYAIFASPEDTELLSRFGFTLYTKPGVKPTPWGNY